MIDGTFGELVELLDARPQVGLAGVRQITADGTLWPTIRRFPSVEPGARRGAVLRALAGPPGVGRGTRARPGRLRARARCDWTSGSFMLARREALLSAGLLDERFFIYSEEPDLCLRIKRAGWEVRHLPQMTIVHHAGKGGVRPRMVAQDAYTRRQYAHKHFGRLYRTAFLSVFALGQLIRSVGAGRWRRPPPAARAHRRALRTLVGRAAPPFGAPPATAVSPVPAALSGLAQAAFEEVR